MRIAAGILPLLLIPALVTAHPPSQDATADKALVITAPAAPGGGWDQTARAMQRVLAEIEPGVSVQVDNVPGAAGTIGLARFIQSERGNPGALLVTGLVMVSGVIINGSPVSLADTTPIARLTGEYEVIVVPASSPFRSLGDLIDAFKKHPGGVSWGGGSAGGTDDLLVRLLAEQIGLPASSVNYIAFAGGGAALAAVLGGQLSAAVSGYAEFAGQIAAGQLRVLAVSSASRVSGIDAPTLRESGIALDLANWRAIVAPPGLSDAEQEALTARITRIATSAQWRATLEQNGWDDQFLTGPALRQFLLSEQSRIEDVLRRLSATNARAPATLAVTLTPSSLPNAIALVFFGVLALTLFTAAQAVGRTRSARRAHGDGNRHRTADPAGRVRDDWFCRIVGAVVRRRSVDAACAATRHPLDRTRSGRRHGVLDHDLSGLHPRPRRRAAGSALVSELLTGFAVALTPSNLFWGLAGTTLGTAVGVLPGIGPALTVALLLPVTYNLDPTAALIMFAGIYYGAMYGGSTTSILLNTPGESATIVTAIDGHQMARNGRAGAALATSAIGSFVAGTLATLALSVTAPLMVKFALAFGSAEYFALMVVAFVMVTTMLGDSRLKGWLSLLLGLTLGFVGIDGLSGRARLSFGIPYLLDGIDPVIVAIGLFAVGETLWVASRGPAIEEVLPVRGSLWMTAAEWSRSWKPWLRGTAIGFPLGALPAGGAELPTLMSYAIEKRLSKRPQEFGRGAIEAVAGPEAANNASAAGTLVPLLTLGLPTSATAAVLLAAFQQFGLQPGPLLFEHESALVWGVIASLYIGNAMLLVLNLPLVGVWVKLLSIPRPWLYGGILVVASLGAFSVHRATGDLVLMAAIGIVGFLLRLIDAPVAPVMIGLILGPAAEQHLRRALAISQGDWTVFATRPTLRGSAGDRRLWCLPCSAGLSAVARSAKADIESSHEAE